MVVNVAGMANNGTCIAHREGLSIGKQSWILLLLVIVWPAKATPAVHSHVQPIKLLSEPTSSWWNVYRTHTLVCSCYDSVTQCGHTPCRLECVCVACIYVDCVHSSTWAHYAPEGKLLCKVIGTCEEVTCNLQQHRCEAEALHWASLQHLQYLR